MSSSLIFAALTSRACGMLIASRMGVEEAAEEQPVRPYRFDELAGHSLSCERVCIKEDIRCPLPNSSTSWLFTLVVKASSDTKVSSEL